MKEIDIRLIENNDGEYIITIALIDVIGKSRFDWAVLNRIYYTKEKILDVKAVGNGPITLAFFSTGEYVMRNCRFDNFGSALKQYERVIKMIKEKIDSKLNPENYDPEKLFKNGRITYSVKFTDLSDNLKSLDDIKY
jgi:hypothetical protein